MRPLLYLVSSRILTTVLVTVALLTATSASSVSWPSEVWGAAVVVVTSGPGPADTGARASTIGSAKADRTMPGEYMHKNI